MVTAVLRLRRPRSDGFVCARALVCCTVMMVDFVFIKSTPLCHSNCLSSSLGCCSDGFVCLVDDPFNQGFT
jgi:hypothetical protein